ncbi:MAG: UDP-N-acetylmuramate--alanine ligase [Bacillota bacterium]|jgi:UDP-N-acetylmuramate--alanine ligase|nr:UDP-N-acetylmuramate--alanine ligase [Bacillota bacterium]MDK2855032.1 UDP-N-acetylmuramate--alanine ligase [Bacillota bacterium]MDK2924846.1 UDP-N-acetylmuramate--alanine ligase [Bacillota bacterium]
MSTTKRTIHFIGIGGAGMSAIAKVLLQAGNIITGSDLKRSETTARLAEMGATIYIGHRVKNLGRPDVVVVSSAIPANNVELVAAREAGIPVVQRGEMLAQLMEGRKGIAVAGAHGKTTTTSMISLALERGGLDPTVLIGGELNDIGGNAKLGGGEYLVAEADESDGSFLRLRPRIAVVTNVEDDHLDYYGTPEKIVEAFSTFVNQVPEDGLAVLCADNANAAHIASTCRRRVVTYGLENAADYEARSISHHALKSSFEVWERGVCLGTFSLSVPGKHNILNALATVAVAREVGIDLGVVRRALAEFHGVHRRFELVGKVGGIYVVDDYGHHPTEIKATLSAAKLGHFNRIICVFQPHRYTRTKFLHREFGTAFGQADELIITDIYPAGEAPIAGVSSKLIVDAVAAQDGPYPVYIPELKDVVPYLLGRVRPGDLVLTVGAGNVWTIGVELVAALGQQEKSVAQA